MAKASSIAKEKKRQAWVDKTYEKRQSLKRIARSLTETYERKAEAQETLNKMSKNSSPTRLRNRCQFTGRARGYLRKFKVSRLCFRKLALEGFLPGVTKASW